ncbi:GLTPD1 [Bugula neritina]|nr:GLTPD1 [Bugula neritina]
MFRLHQAMAFLVHFFTNVREQPNAKMHTIVNEAYKDTISRNHGWLVRKTATLAFHAIPSRNSLINRIRHEGATESSIMDELGEIIDVTKYVYMVVANTFDTHSNIAVKEPKTLKPDTS